MAVTKKEADGEHPAGHYLVVEDPEHPTTWHLRVKDAAGKPDHGLMGAAKAALGKGYRGNKYDGPKKSEAIEKLKSLYKSEGMKWDDTETANEGPRFVIDLSHVALGEGPNGLTRVAIACTGQWVKDGHKFSITNQDLADIAKNFAKLGTDGRQKTDIVVDYEHASEFPELAQGGAVQAAGWIKNIVAPSAGDSYLYADIQFTDEARQLIAAQKVKYLSPALNYAAEDKRTGQPQGTTLTSLAVTNRPFLEELPAITLSDRGYQFVDVSQVHVPGQATAARNSDPATGGKEKPMKKVKVSAIKAGDNAGHLKISHPDFSDGNDYYANKDDVKEAMSDAADVESEGGKKLAEVTGLAGKKLSEQLPEVRRRFEVKVISLADVPVKAEGPDKGAPDFAAFAPGSALVAGEVFEAKAKEEILDEAIRKGSVLPKERAHLRKFALADLRSYLADRTGRVIDTTEHGVGGAGAEGTTGKEAVTVEFDSAVRKVLSEKRAKNYGDAMRVVGQENPELRRRYDEAQRAKTKV